jgi:hypothetical protein
MQLTSAPRAVCPSLLRGGPRQRPKLIITCATQNSRDPVDRRELLAGSAALAAYTLLLNGSNPALAAAGEANSIYSFSHTLDGKPFEFSQFKNKVVCIVNIASQ